MSRLKKLPKILVVLGPTASGKSALAVGLAKKFDGEIISADSRQIYRSMDIGTGKITKKEMESIPHYLLDVASPKQKFTVTRFQKLAKSAIQKILKKRKLPIICGGTGLYIDALLYDWKLPEVKPNLELRAKLEKKSTGELFLELKKLDLKRAKEIDWHNRRRLIRALEIVIGTGRSSHSSVILNKRTSGYEVLKVGIKLPGEELKKRIKERLEARIGQGMLKEIKELHEEGLSWSRLDSFGLEYRWASKHLRGEISKSQLMEKLNTEIWRYAKRQMTWFKRDKNINWVSSGSEAETLVRKFIR